MLQLVAQAPATFTFFRMARAVQMPGGEPPAGE
jgi:hypothetical protein